MSHDLVFLHANYAPACNARVDKRYEGYSVLQFMDGGGLELSYDDNALTLEGNWFWTCEPRAHVRFHVARAHRSWSHRYVAFRGPLINEWRLSGLWFSTPQQVEPAAEYAAQFDELLSMVRRDDKWSRRLGINILERILLQLAAEREGGERRRRNEAWLQTIVARLADVTCDADYQALAADCGMSLSHLRLQFRRACGVPLHTYVVQRRIAAARSLLIETELPIKAIAARLGYADVHFFTRQFRRFTGLTPGAYRKSRQG